MNRILSIFEEGNNRLFLVGDNGPAGERVFRWRDNGLDVFADGGLELWHVPLDPSAHGLIVEGHAHWIECHAEQVVLDVLIVLTETAHAS